MDGQLIGVDLGGTKLSVGALEGGTLGPEHERPTEKSSGDALVEQIIAAVEEVRGDGAAAVGVGIPSVVEFASGRARSSVNVPLKDVPLRAIMRERLGLPVFVDNDATCAALAEAHDGGRLAVNDLAMFTVGTGVGGGLVLGGRVYRGATGAAAELGHTLIGLDLERGAPQAAERFPQPGSLEALAAGRALGGLAKAAAQSEPESALGRLAAEGREVDGRDAVAAARDGDATARQVVRVLGERLGVGIANAINTFDPEVVAIGGGVSGAGDLLLEPARESARRFILPGVGERTEIRLARHGAEAGLLGAALLAGQELRVERGQPAAPEPPHRAAGARTAR